MKKLNSQLVLFLIMIFLGISCKKDDSKPAEPTSMTVKTMPTKTDYLEGENLELDGLVVTLTLDNGDEEDVALAGFTEEGLESSITDGTALTLSSTSITITHSVTGVNTNFDIVVGSVADPDGNIYHKVTIGTQVWMQENLRTTKYSDGTDIPSISDNAEWAALSTPGMSFQPSTDQDVQIVTYGRLYNGYAVNTGKLCPTGWHMPSLDEWNTLFDYLGGDAVAGDKMREAGTAHWKAPNEGADNSSGFTALPGGYRYSNGAYGGSEINASWWSSTETNTGMLWYIFSYYQFSQITKENINNEYGFSVRCLKDN